MSLKQLLIGSILLIAGLGATTALASRKRPIPRHVQQELKQALARENAVVDSGLHNARTNVMQHRPGYVRTVYQVPKGGTDRSGSEGMKTVRAFEIFNLTLSPAEQEAVKHQIRSNDNKHVLLLKPSVLAKARNGRVKVTLNERDGMIPKSFIGREVTIGDNNPALLDSARSDDPHNIEGAAEIRTSPANLYRIPVDGKLLVSLNKNRLKKGKLVATPIGGGYDFLGETGRAAYVTEGIQMTPAEENKPYAMRQIISPKDLPAFIHLFEKGVGRELSGARELEEELVGEEDVFTDLPRDARTLFDVAFNRFSSIADLRSALHSALNRHTTNSRNPATHAEIDAMVDLVGAYHTELRDDGRPYSFHPLELSYYVLAGLGDANRGRVLGAGLHDLAEDTPIGFEQIRNRFGSAVEVITRDLTEHSEYRQYAKLRQNNLNDTAVSDGWLAENAAFAAYQSPWASEPLRGRIATKIEHLDRVEQNGRAESILIKAIDRLHNLYTNEAPSNSIQRRMEALEIERWNDFLNDAVAVAEE